MKPLTMSLIPGPLTDSVLSGEVVVEGDAELAISAGPSVDNNSRKMLDGAFDVAEMSFSTYIKARDLGKDLIGLPIFTGRGFLQPGLVCSTASGIRRPEDIATKRVGLPQYWMTSSVWHRLILEQQHGVREDAVQWFTTNEERFDKVPEPAGVSIERLPEGMSLEDALAQGRVDATMVPPRGAAKKLSETVRSPYENLPDAERAYFSATGIFPIMHFVVMRESVNKEMPALAGALVSAFGKAKQHAAQHDGLPPIIPGMTADDERRLAGDPWAFGLAENKRALEAFLGFSRAHAWVSNTLSVQDCFVGG
jgi:4,5-dihydroxyphthalate decarboxylase